MVNSIIPIASSTIPAPSIIEAILDFNLPNSIISLALLASAVTLIHMPLVSATNSGEPRPKKSIKPIKNGVKAAKKATNAAVFLCLYNILHDTARPAKNINTIRPKLPRFIIISVLGSSTAPFNRGEPIIIPANSRYYKLQTKYYLRYISNNFKDFAKGTDNISCLFVLNNS